MAMSAGDITFMPECYSLCISLIPVHVYERSKFCRCMLTSTPSFHNPRSSAAERPWAWYSMQVADDRRGGADAGARAITPSVIAVCRGLVPSFGRSHGWRAGFIMRGSSQPGRTRVALPKLPFPPPTRPAKHGSCLA